MNSRSCKGMKIRVGFRQLRTGTRDIPYIVAGVVQVAVNITIVRPEPE